MNDFIIYILKSTISISLLYLVFRTLMRKETFFKLNRALLLSAVVCSAIIPLLYLPQIIQPAIQNQWMSRLQNPEITPDAQSPLEGSTQTFTFPTEQTKTIIREEFPWMKLLQTVYLAGILITLLILIHGIVSILILFRKAQFRQMDGFRLLIIEHEIPPFSFGRFVIISQSDYDAHQQTILAHEQAHIRLNHFFDLALLETAKAFHWFNPVIYWLIRDMKEIHEFQADQYTLNIGIDATQYQILIIQKSVGPQRFALANSFNHCQIKKRIIMMNKQKTSKAGLWKVATFLPLLALLLMAFSKTGENVPEKENVPIKIISAPEITKNQNEQTSLSIEIKKDGNYIDNKLCSLEEIVKRAKAWQKTNEEVLLLVDGSIPYSRIDEIRETLENAKVYFVNQSSPNSEEIIYPAGDASEFPKFTQGKWDDWMENQLKNLDSGKKYKITYSFIIDKNGKVRDGHIIKSSEYPEINSAIEKILNKIPDWNPAKKGEIAVNVLYKEIAYKK